MEGLPFGLWFMGIRGPEGDPVMLALTGQLFTSVLCKAKLYCYGQPVMLVGDLNADPLVIPSLARGTAVGELG